MGSALYFLNFLPRFFPQGQYWGLMWREKNEELLRQGPRPGERGDGDEEKELETGKQKREVGGEPEKSAEMGRRT